MFADKTVTLGTSNEVDAFFCEIDTFLKFYQLVYLIFRYLTLLATSRRMHLTVSYTVHFDFDTIGS